MLKVNHIAKSFKGKSVLNNVSFEANEGQLVHISGANGSGKSTLFKIIAKVLLPDSGAITIIESAKIGALIENPGFLEFETGLANLRFLAKLNHNYDEKKVCELMERFALDPNNRQPVSKYSVGMRQKLGIIQAVMEDQSIILLDEPTRGLDTDSIDQFIDLLKILQAKNKLVIVASHDYIEGIKYDTLFTLKNGTLSYG
ncbi:ABC transporter ATP-binding protein [Leuconostoc gelidum subsp. aenigmaticum]|uniref:ABC transporter, ATP-binding protein n=1 Tax=Leuconostoc gasicomitatum TaxID=115778 RepID=A0ABM9UZV2_9LACO|nr:MULTISPECIES: ABC transporter ATP-binding protein [Leuconostoc gelidum group]MBZ5984438.1 ABC transporter ATP-binding protein [Leuconostoc gasicomitatum]MBZ6003935.1 ABC transporter ATP-binding protein [Leuconostoc gelidum subsp. aenigmaticum]CUW05254.1 ABC transporter, ATP-binding protein [Leuconostoc gasicomitatum]